MIVHIIIVSPIALYKSRSVSYLADTFGQLRKLYSNIPYVLNFIRVYLTFVKLQ